MAFATVDGIEIEKRKVIEKVKSATAKRVKVAIADIDGLLRGKVMHSDKFLSSLDERFGFCNVVFGWDIADSCYDNSSYTGWHTGYPDCNARIDLTSYRTIPWEENCPFFLADFETPDGASLPITPRNLLKKIRSEAIEMGYHPLFSSEIEWFNFKENSQELHKSGFQKPTPLTNGMFGYSLLRSSQNSPFFNDLFDSLAAFGIPLEGLHTETGPGVYEAAITYADILEAADRATLFRAATKEIAHRHGIIPTFMARWSEKLPGCSGHIHQSLADLKNGDNLFYGNKGMSPLMEHYLAGQLHCLPYLLPMYAPTVNSYKRLVEGYWAPTTVSWGIDNRTVAIRALPHSKKACRIELRVPGADSNPYLAMAASLASGLYGVKHKIALDIPPVTGNGYGEKRWGSLASTLSEATAIMREAKIATELFGDSFVDHFIGTREWEWRQQQKTVTDWELKRYFEAI